MDSIEVQKHLVDVLTLIQAVSGEACPTLDPTVKPAEHLPKFNSKVWPVAAGMLSSLLGNVIPPEVNIFVDDDTNQAFTIAQTVMLVCSFVKQPETHDAVNAA